MFGKSFIYNRKSSTDPWVTPQVISFNLDDSPL